MHTLRHALAAGALMLVASTSADAQLRRSTSTTFPDAQSLPAGTCRVWIDGVPANRQPAPSDCDTARRRQPRNSRIIYGAGRSTNVYGNRDPRSIPGSSQYDPRYDPRSAQYDPRLDPHNNGRWNDDRDKKARKHEREHEKAERKHEKEHDKEWKKSNKRGGRDDEESDDRDRNDGDRNRERRGGSRRMCVDANRDGICDSLQPSSQAIPRGIPQTVPQGSTRRVCTDANRDGRCDDGGPLVRVTP
ncbi:MAG: hypothetical protein ABIV10_04770, partial [Gemmatimonadaceae bacterium]